MERKSASMCPEFWDYVGNTLQGHSAFLMSIFESPWDDSPIFVRGRNIGLRFNPETCSLNIHFIESQLYISMLCDFVSYAYRLLGRSKDAKYFTTEALRLRNLVADNCWDEETGFYYDCDGASGKRRTFVKHAGAFFAMLMGIPTQEQAQRMVQHLMNPGEFWTEYPVPSISRDSPDYSPDSGFSGRSWPTTNFFVLRGLLNYGFFDEADELLSKWMKQVETCVERPVQYFRMLKPVWQSPEDVRHVRIPDVQWISPENWNSETGAVHSSGGLVWGGLWMPSLIMRYFWPVGDDHVLLRPGKHFRLRWGTRWDVEISDDLAYVNGRRYKLKEKTTYLLKESTGDIRALEPGRADPVVLQI